MSEFHAEAPQATASEGLSQGPYVAARAGFEPMTLWTKGDKCTNEPPRPKSVSEGSVLEGICSQVIFADVTASGGP